MNQDYFAALEYNLRYTTISILISNTLGQNRSLKASKQYLRPKEAKKIGGVRAPNFPMPCNKEVGEKFGVVSCQERRKEGRRKE